MVFEDGFFHADPHPGNLFVAPDGRLGLVDFGMVGSIDAPTRSRLIRVFIATAAGDAPTLPAELLGLGVHTAPAARTRLPQDLAAPSGDVTNVPPGAGRPGP